MIVQNFATAYNLMTSAVFYKQFTKKNSKNMTYFEMAVAFDVSKIFKFCFQILKANRILFQRYLNRFSKFSSPDAVQRAKTVKIISFENGAPFCNYDVIKKFFLENVPLRHGNLL